jgi:hypothetical protein
MTQYWSMQLHPADPQSAMRYAVESVAAGFIGLDFKGEPGDLRNVKRETLATGERDYWDFANQMQRGDRVLIIVHHFPFALVTVDGDYNYIARTEPALAVWFRHFRRIDRGETRYFADYRTNAAAWDQFRMTDTISILRSEDGQRIRLMKDWIASIPAPAT